MHPPICHIFIFQKSVDKSDFVDKSEDALLRYFKNSFKCIKMVVSASFEYFFIMADTIGDFHSFIYVHQTRTSLCLHRLSADTTEDELNVCADFMQTMDALDAYEELFVCTNYIRNDRKLRLLVGRPNYNARDLESATIVISAQMLINEAADEGPPRYYAIGKRS